VGGENVTGKTLTEVLNHVVTLGLAMNQNVKAELLLDLDNFGNLLLNELLVLLSSDLALGELVSLDTDLLGLRERSDCGGREKRKLDGLGLLGDTDREGRLAVVLLRGDGSLALLDLRVVGTLGRGTSLHRLGVGLELLTDSSGALGDSLGDDNHFAGLLDSKAEPVLNFRVEVLLAGKSVGNVEKRAGGRDNHTVLAKLLNSKLNLLNGGLEVGLPDVTAVNNTSREDLLGTKSADNRVELLRVADKINVNTVKVVESREDIDVMDNVTEVGSEDQTRSLRTKGAKLLVGRLESVLRLERKIKDEDRLINLNVLNTSLLELGEEFDVQRKKFVDLGDGVQGLTTVSLGEGQEGDRTKDDGAGDDTSLLGLEELNDRLGVGSKLEGLVILESRLDVVVVGVKPLHHLQGGDIDGGLAILGRLLETTAHSEVLVKGVEVVLGITLRDNTKELDVVKDLVVERKVIAGDDVDTSILLDFPVLRAKSLSLAQEFLTRDLLTPVSFRGLLEVTELSHTRETENSAAKERERSV
jgi:hypothetical protein